MLLWPPANVVPSTRALLHDRRGGRSISVEGTSNVAPACEAVSTAAPLSLISEAPSSTPRCSGCLQPCPAAVAGKDQSSSEGKEVSEEN